MTFDDLLYKQRQRKDSFGEFHFRWLKIDQPLDKNKSHQNLYPLEGV